VTRRTAAASLAALAATAAGCFPDYAIGNGSDGGGDGESGSSSGSGGSSGSSSGGPDGGSDGAGDATTETGDDAMMDAATDVQGDRSDGSYTLDAGDGAILSGMVAVDGGAFTFPVYVGGGDITAYANLDYQVAIDRTEVTVGEFTAFVQAGLPLPCGDGGVCSLDPSGPYASSMLWDPSWNGMAQSDAYVNGSATCTSDLGSPIITYNTNGSYPITCVPWQQALAYCAWLGKRLPTDTEWRFFATGAGTRPTYPWGSTSPDCSYATGDFDGGRCGFPVVVGHANLGVSKDGVYDLVGSLSEWLWDQCSASGNYGYPFDAGTDYLGPTGAAGGGSADRLWIPSDWSDQASSYFGSDRSGAGSADTTVGYDNCGFRCALTTRYP